MNALSHKQTDTHTTNIRQSKVVSEHADISVAEYKRRIRKRYEKATGYVGLRVTFRSCWLHLPTELSMIEHIVEISGNKWKLIISINNFGSWKMRIIIAIMALIRR